MKYDHNRLVVCPEWCSSGIWHPQLGTVNGPVIMVSHESLNLPTLLSERFNAWIEWHDNDFLPERPGEFPWEEFNKEGALLASELARFLGTDYQVEYKGQKLPHQHRFHRS